jgi:hypothetical protein
VDEGGLAVGAVDRGGELLAALVVDVGEQHGRAFVREQARRRFADAARGARDDRNLSLQSRHGLLNPG